jgi:hypothetical protein
MLNRMLNRMSHRTAVMSLTIALGLAGVSQPSIAADRAETSQLSAPVTQPKLQTSDVVPQTTCKLALVAQVQNPVAYGTEKIVGRVYNVVGSMVYLELDDGTTAVTTLSMWEKGKLGNIIGRRIVVTPYYCNRANLDTTLKWTPAKAIEVPPLTFSNSAPVSPPLTPRPEMTPAPVQTPMPVQQPEIIPQTW